MTKLCNTCEYLRYCARSGIEDVGCDRYKKDMTTNEEWLKSLNTEQLAKMLLNAIQDCKSCASGIGIAEKPDDMPCPFGGCWDVKDVEEWLKQPHTP